MYGISSLMGKKCQIFTDNFALQGIALINRSLIKCVCNGSNLDARKDLAMAALLSGISLSNFEE